MTATLPLLAGHSTDSPLAWRAGRAITAGQYMADVQALAARLPAQGALVNLCTDRYRFAVGLGAAMLRGHPSLLPPNALAATLARLRLQHPTLYALTDDVNLVLQEIPLICCDADGLAGTSVGPWPAVPVDQVAATLLTSGSTGEPQPHAKTWGTLVTNIRAEAHRLAEMLGQAADADAALAGWSLVATVPGQHSYGFESSVLLAMLSGAAFDAGRPYFPADMAEALALVPRPRALVTTPFHLKTFLAAELPLPEVDVVLSATAPLSPQLAREAETRLSAVLIEIYGCTEAGQVATRRTAASEVWQTFGELRLARREARPAEPAATDEPEQYWVQGGHVHAPTQLSDVLDLVDDRHFRLLGRANDVINVAGKRSSLAHLNYHLNSVPGVQDGAFWLPDDQADAVVRPVVFVVAPELSGRQIIDALRTRVEAVFLPRKVVQVDTLPREATGKLTAQTLRAFALARLDEQGPG